MKKTININLGGQPFIIDEEAFDILHGYLEALKDKFTNEAEQKEILSDIEARIAEVFTQRLGKIRAVVNEEDVVYIISLLGKPEDIAGESEGPSASPADKKSSTNSTAYSGNVEKKLFRDPDNKKVGGVISGFCYYFGWGDPTWIRIALVAVIVLSVVAKLSLGFPIAVIYLILLIVVPEAETSAEKLQMRGQPVTIQNIEKEVREAMTTAGHSVNSFLRSEGTGGRLAKGMIAVLKALVKIFSVFLLLICAFIMLVFLSSLFGYALLTGVSLSEVAHLIISSESLLILFYIGAVLFIFIPLIAIMYDVIRFLTKSQAQNPVLKRVLWFSWAVAIICICVVGIYSVKNFNVAETTNAKTTLARPSTGTLHVQLADGKGKIYKASRQDDDDDFSTETLFPLSPLRTDNGFGFTDVRLEITTSPDSNFYLEKVYFSRGANTADALKNIEGMHYLLSQKDTLLNLDNMFEIPLHSNYRGQSIKIRIYVPEGQRVSFADNVEDISYTIKNKDHHYTRIAGRTFEVRDGKLSCLNCKKDAMINIESDDMPEAPEAPEPPVAPTPSKDLNVESVNINDHGISVHGKDEKNHRVDIEINDKAVKINVPDTSNKKK